jgi:DMSO reductase anchor subunit
MKRRQPFAWYFYFMGIAFFLINALVLSMNLIDIDSAITFPVKTKNYKKVNENVLINYAKVSIVQNQTEVVIKQPNFEQRLLWPNANGSDSIKHILYGIGCICYLWVLIMLKDIYTPYTKNISTPLLIAAISTMVVALFYSFRKHFINLQIELLTNNEFRYDKYGDDDNSSLIWIGLFLFLILSWYKKGYKLQQEQNFTI